MTRISILLVFLTAGFYSLVVSAARFNPPALRSSSPLNKRQFKNCSIPINPITTAPKQNVWDGFSTDEVNKILEWLYDKKHGLNLTTNTNAGAWDNYITIVELLHPNKTDVLSYYDGNGNVPKKQARVVVSVGATEEPYLQEYVLGPLPISSATTIAPLTFVYNKGDGRTSNYYADDLQRMQWLATIGAGIADITLDLLGTVAAGAENDTSIVFGPDPRWKENGRIIQWLQYWGINPTGYESSTLLPQGLYFKFDVTGRNPEGWKLLAILYDDILYDSISSFRKAWSTPGFNKLPKVIANATWANTGQEGEPLPYDTQSPPISIQPDGQRFAVDKDAKYVSWMDFTFYIGFTRDLGVALYDIKYKGKRILYELGLQEALAHYSGNDPVQSGTAYMDSYYGFGPGVFELVAGYDCPAYSTFLDNHLFENGVTTTHKRSICLFEQDAGYPIQRHTTSKYVSVTRNTIFTLRTVATIGNYDYNFDYIFYLNGAIEVKVRASGYIQAAYSAHNEEYGYRIQESLSGSMHSHVLNFKADFDIAGEKNSFEKVDIVGESIDYKWADAPRNTMKLKRSFLKTEDEGKINWPANSASMYVIVNKDEVNAWGEPKGYRIMPGSGSQVHLAIQNSSNLGNTVGFGTHHLYVTKQKDTEPRAAAASNFMNPDEPLVNFDEFFDGESLEQEDLVVWFNLGMHHVPHTGDLPNTVFTTAQSSVLISPHNYLLGDSSRQTSQQIQINFDENARGDSVADYFGSSQPTCQSDIRLLYPDQKIYEAPTTVRKFPYYQGGG